MSDGLTFPPSLENIDLDHNNLNGTVDWSIFNGMYNLKTLDIDFNQLSGTIDWEIIADLHQNGKLQNIYLWDNDFTGTVDFKWITKNIQLSLPLQVHCMYKHFIYKKTQKITFKIQIYISTKNISSSKSCTH